ncbi:MAG: DUF58 domain-containing protein [Thaumarchaeota archaeon]|nr:DUF58 domain-containing protein [Nitrososphaerota archaeon]
MSAVFRRTPRGSTILLLSAVLVALGIVGALESQAFLLYAGVALFLYYYVAKLLLQMKVKALDRLDISRKFRPRIDEGATLDVGLGFVNRTFVRLSLEVIDSYPPFFRLKSGTNVALIQAPAKGFAELHYEITPTSIGSNAFGPLRLVTRDIAGLFFYERRVKDGVQDEVEVTPLAKELARGVLAAAAISAYGGIVTSRKKGEGLELADIRPYEPGDPFKRIAWHATAKTGNLMVRELNAETQLNVMVVLDSTETMAYGEAGRTKLDYAARAVASLVSYLSRRGDFVGLTVLQGDAPALVLPLAKGQAQTYKLLKVLGALSPEKYSAEALKNGINRCLALGRVKGKTLFFVITDLDFDRDLLPLKQLLGMKHEVIVTSPYTPLFEAHGLKGLDRMIYSIGTSHQWRTRKRLVNQALALGVPVFDVGPDDLFAKLVLQVEELRRKGGS